MAHTGLQPAPRKAVLPLIIFAAALSGGIYAGVQLGWDFDWRAFGILACFSVAVELLQARTGRRALQSLPYDAALYAAILLMPGGTAALLGPLMLGTGLLRRLPWEQTIGRAATMTAAGWLGGLAADRLLAAWPGWQGMVAALAVAGLVIVASMALWQRPRLYAWRTVGSVGLQTAAAGALLAHQMSTGQYAAFAVTAGLFLLVRQHVLQRAQTIARDGQLAEYERAWSEGMGIVRDVVRALDAATTPQALTAELAYGIATLPRVAAVAIWEAAGAAPPRLAAFGRARTAQDSDGTADDEPAAVLSALPPPGIAQAMRSGIVRGDRISYVRIRSGPKVQAVAEVTMQPGAEVDLVLHLVGAAIDYFGARLKNLDLMARAQDDFLATVRVLAATVDARDPYTRQHSENVSLLARRIALEMGLSPTETGDIAMAGLLHDIGKIGIPDAILTKKGRLDVAERQLMMSHAERGAAIVLQAEPLVHLAPLVRHHHEWHDGNGYPDGLRGEQIPLGAAIIAVADAYDTMTSDRPYRPGVAPEVAIAELQRCAGTQFHPEVAAAAVHLLSRGTVPKAAVAETRLPASAQHTLAGGHHQVEFVSVRMLQRLTAELSLVLNLDELLNRSLEIIRDEMGFTTGCILLRGEGETVSVAAATGFLSPLVGCDVPPGRGLSRWVIEHGKPLRIDDVDVDARYYGGPGSHRIGSELAVPLTADRVTHGCLIVSSERTYGFTEQDEAMLAAAAEPLARTIGVALLHRAQPEQPPPPENDSLTGALNRRGLERALAAALAEARREAPVWVAAFDLNGFSRFNQLHGFRAGDAVLQEMVTYLSAALGDGAIVGRLSGDHLLAILPPDTGEDAAAFVAEVVASWAGMKIQAGSDVVTVPPIIGGVAACPHDLSRVGEVMHWGDHYPKLTPEAAKLQLTASAGD